MVLKQEELLTKYFEHRMSVEEEQNFLIQLAASDDLRTAFRSHLELQKAIRDDKDDLRAVAQVRNRTLVALGLSAAAVTPFIEQELMKSRQNAETAAQPVPQMASIAPKASTFSRLAGILRSRSVILTSGLLIGFTAATAIFSPHSNQPATVPATTAVHQNTASEPSSISTTTSPDQAPAVDSRATSTSTGPETIHSSRSLNTTSHSVTSPSSRTATLAGGRTAAVGTTDHETAASTTHAPATVNVTKPAALKVRAAKVSKIPDSTTKE